LIWTEDKNIRQWLPRLQAHRGLWVRGLAQNTLESVAAAYELGYEIAEFDVRMTSDGVVIMFHDDHFQNNLISNLSLTELRQQTPVTTFSELLTWFSTTEKFKLNIEIKSKSVLPFQLEKKVCEALADLKLEERVLISSFNPVSLYKVRLFNPNIYRALLLSFERENGNNLLVMSGVLNYLCKPHMLNLRHTDYSKHFKTLAKKIPVVLWTVNDLEIYKKYKAEIHGIISDTVTPAEFEAL
jgi:glycerophosphoryl diester phosphodiesterase